MEITITEFFLFVWAMFATLAAAYFHELLQVAKRFTVRLLEDPDLYKEVTAKINANKEKQNVNGL